MTTGQEKRKTIHMPTGFNVGSMIWVAIRSNTSRYGPIPIRKAAPLIKRKNLPTFCTVVSGFWFTSAICTNQNININLSVRVSKPRQINAIPGPSITSTETAATMLREHADAALANRLHTLIPQRSRSALWARAPSAIA